MPNDAELADGGLGEFAGLMEHQERLQRPPGQRPNSTKAIPDVCSPAGAAALARRIKAFWHQAGFAIEITTFKTAHGDNDSRGVVSLRSNLVAGLPPRQ